MLHHWLLEQWTIQLTLHLSIMWDTQFYRHFAPLSNSICNVFPQFLLCSLFAESYPRQCKAIRTKPSWLNASLNQLCHDSPNSSWDQHQGPSGMCFQTHCSHVWSSDKSLMVICYFCVKLCARHFLWKQQESKSAKAILFTPFFFFFFF